MTRSIAWLFALAACTGDGEPFGARSDAVQYEYGGHDYYEVALAEPGALGEAVRATGTVHVTALDSSGIPKLAVDGTPLRYTCGVTFISPQHAITAAHCVDSVDIPDPDTHSVTVQTYHLSDDVPWQSAKDLSGTFPSYTHPMLTSAQGYVVENHTCFVTRRCGQAWGTEIDCTQVDGDTALLHCPSAPGCSTGYLDVAEEDDPDAPVEMAWTHEVYSIPNVPSDDRYQHYTLYTPPNIGPNFHYFGAGRNQLLPLVSRAFLEGDIFVEHAKLGIVDVGDRIVQWTDMLGCHGTSGANALQLDGGSFEILGPMSAGGPMLNSRLCIPPSSGSPGVQNMGYAIVEFTQQAAEGVCRRAESCEDGGGDPENYLGWLFCHRVRIPELVNFPDWPWLWGCVDCPPWERIRIYDEPMVELGRGARVTIPDQTYVAGATYRFSARVVPAATGPSLVNVSIGGTAVLSRARPVASAGERAGVIAGSFAPRTSGPAALTIEADLASGGTLGVTEVVVWRDGATNAFDRYDMRAGAGLISPAVAGGALVPMRFTGDGRGGYAALLSAGERMLLTRQALLAGRTYTVSFTGTRDGPLSCALMLGDSTERRAACDVRSGRATVRLTGPAGVTPIAIAIDAAAGRATTRIDDVVIR
jgi:hypothetical protein